VSDEQLFYITTSGKSSDSILNTTNLDGSDAKELCKVGDYIVFSAVPPDNPYPTAYSLIGQDDKIYYFRAKLKRTGRRTDYYEELHRVDSNGKNDLILDYGNVMRGLPESESYPYTPVIANNFIYYYRDNQGCSLDLETLNWYPMDW
jgi:hypothetical protein